MEMGTSLKTQHSLNGDIPQGGRGRRWMTQEWNGTSGTASASYTAPFSGTYLNWVYVSRLTTPPSDHNQNFGRFTAFFPRSVTPACHQKLVFNVIRTHKDCLYIRALITVGQSDLIHPFSEAVFTEPIK